MNNLKKKYHLSQGGTMNQKKLRELVIQSLNELREIQFRTITSTQWSEPRTVIFFNNTLFIHTNIRASTFSKPERLFTAVTDIKLLEKITGVHYINRLRYRIEWIQKHLRGEFDSPTAEEKERMRTGNFINKTLDSLAQLKKFALNKSEFDNTINSLKENFFYYLE